MTKSEFDTKFPTVVSVFINDGKLEKNINNTIKEIRDNETSIDTTALCVTAAVSISIELLETVLRELLVRPD